MSQVVFTYNAARQPGKSSRAATTQLTAKVIREARVAVMAAMETGNFDRARMLLTEIEDQLPEFAEHLKLDIIEAYGITL